MHWIFPSPGPRQTDLERLCLAHTLFQRARRRAILRRLWSAITRRPRTLAQVDERTYTPPSGTWGTSSFACVSLQLIHGSAKPGADFDAHFDPLTESTRKRWIGIAWADLRGSVLPPIEVVRIGDHYYVRDGHYRVSVARALGRRAIEARVTTSGARRLPATAPIGEHRSATIVGSSGRYALVLRAGDSQGERPSTGTPRIVQHVSGPHFSPINS